MKQLYTHLITWDEWVEQFQMWIPQSLRVTEDTKTVSYQVLGERPNVRNLKIRKIDTRFRFNLQQILETARKGE